MSEAEEKAGERRKGPIADISEFSRERGGKEGMGILQLSCRASKSLPNNIFAGKQDQRDKIAIAIGISHLQPTNLIIDLGTYSLSLNLDIDP